MRNTIVPTILAMAITVLAVACGSDDGTPKITKSLTPSVTPATESTAAPDSPSSTTLAADVTTLTSTTWVLAGFITVGGPDPALSDAQPTLAFDSAGKAFIDTGCNMGSADVKIGDDGTITFGPVALTKKACSDALNTLEQRIVNLLGMPSYFSVYDGHLSIYPATVTDTGMLFDATARG